MRRFIARASVKAIVAGIASLALVFTMATPTEAAPESTAPGPYVAPLVPSAPLTQVKTQLPTGDFSPGSGDIAAAAVKKAKTATKAVPKPSKKVVSTTFDPNTSKLEKRDQFSNTYANTDGSHTTEISPLPVNVKVGSKWQPSSTSLDSATNPAW